MLWVVMMPAAIRTAADEKESHMQQTDAIQRDALGTPTAVLGGPVMELRSVSKRFGVVQALQDVSFTIQHGEVVALLGPNGAGKTTAISILLGLRQPTSGSAQLLGMDARSQQARSRCGVMLQESGVPTNLSVREVITLFRSYYPRPLPTARLIEMAGLEEKARARVGTLSGGQRQRLYFALALAGDPDVIVLDEPTASLDIEARREFWAEMRGFVQSGKTIVLTTHYLEEADALADRVIVIAQGHILADATPAALKSRITGKRVRFDLAAQLDEAVLADLPVRQLELTPHHVSLLSTDPEGVLRALFALDVQFHNLEVTGASLEEAVLELTSR